LLSISRDDSRLQGKREARKDHGRSVPRETSILNILAKATDKTTGAALSDAQIVAQAQVLGPTTSHDGTAMFCRSAGCCTPCRQWLVDVHEIC